MAQASETRSQQSRSDASVAELMRQLSEQTSTLVRQELELARVEMTAKGKQAGIGFGMFGAAGVIGLYTVGALIACVILLLSTAMTAWLAALIVAVALGAVAAITAMTGRSHVRKGVPPTPEQTVQTVKQDVHTIEQRAAEGRR